MGTGDAQSLMIKQPAVPVHWKHWVGNLRGILMGGTCCTKEEHKRGHQYRGSLSPSFFPIVTVRTAVSVCHQQQTLLINSSACELISTSFLQHQAIHTFLLLFQVINLIQYFLPSAATFESTEYSRLLKIDCVLLRCWIACHPSVILNWSFAG